MATESAETSLTLLNRVQSNDDEAWCIFTRLYGPIVYAWCRNAGLQPDDVDDVGQEIFRTVSVKLSSFDPDRKSSGAFRSWLWGITRFEVLHYLRRGKRQPVSAGGTDHNFRLQQLEQQTDEPDCIDGMTPRQLVLKSAIELLKAEFDPRTWQAFQEMAIHGRAAKDVGEELKMSAKAVRQAKFRVSKKLRVLLDEDFADLVSEIDSRPKS